VSNNRMENFLMGVLAKNTIARTNPDDFEVLRNIGSGSYGKVYSIVKDGELRALKIQEFYEKSDGGVVSGALREYLFFRLFTRHPNVLTCESAWRTDNQLFTIFPLYSANAKMLRDLHLPTFNDFLFLARGVCSGLESMHAQSWMHRDIKLENILVDENRGSCLADFNLSRWACTSEDSFGASWFQSSASSHICTLWTRPPEVVMAELSGNLRCSYSTEFDMFSLGATLFAFIARDYVFGALVKGIGKSEAEKYLNAYLDVLGCDDEIKSVYGHAYTEGMPSFARCEQRIHELLQRSTMWSKEQKDRVVPLLIGLLHPIASKRYQWEQVNAWFENEMVPTSWSTATAICLRNKRLRMQQKSCALQLDFECSINDTDTYRRGATLPCDTFWGMCGNSSIPPQIACEALRIKFHRPYSIQQSQAILFILDVLHNYSSAAVSAQLCYFSPEDIWDVAKHLPSPRLDILQLATKNRKSPFKICCLASELATSGDVENPDKLEETKIMYLSSSVPYYAAYGNQWKSQAALRQTWVRLCSLGWAPQPLKSE